MARVTIILSAITAVIALLGGLRWLVSEWRNWRTRRRITVLFVLLCSSCSLSEAATLYVKQSSSGSNNGSDWTNALGASFTPARGNTYYLADGASYGGKTWSTANSGTTQIIIRKATVADHGTSTGWDDTMGDGQAIFGSWDVTTDYWLFDGQRRNSNWRTGGINEYGIRVKCTGNCKPLRMDVGDGSGGADNVTFQYVDFEGGGRDQGHADSDIVYTLYGGSNITFQFCALHDSDRTIFLTRNTPTNWVLDHNYIARQASSPAVHGEMWSLTSAQNLTIRHNAIEDTEGTACLIAGLNDGTWDGATIYGNTVRHTAAYISGGREGCSALIYVADDASQTNTASNVAFAQNTLVDLQTTAGMLIIENNPSGGNTFQNNLLYNTEDSGLTGVDTVQSNWIFSLGSGSPGGTNLQTCTVSCDIFVNLSGGDFHLTSNTNAGATLSTPYDVDPDGVTRSTWSRGAFEYDVGGGGGAPTLALFLQSIEIMIPLIGIGWHFRRAMALSVTLCATATYRLTIASRLATRLAAETLAVKYLERNRS